MPVFRPEGLEGRPFWVVQVEVEDGPPQSILLEQTGDTEVKVDWETHVCYQPVPWDRYAKERPTGTTLEFRVFVQRDVFYSHEFSDSGKWRCFRLTARNATQHVFGYAPAGSELARVLDACCDAAPSNVATVILKLRVPEQSASPRGVVIEKLVEPRWVRIASETRETGESP
jgi:hypothetical protein